jgi:hypothetical protein
LETRHSLNMGNGPARALSSEPESYNGSARPDGISCSAQRCRRRRAGTVHFPFHNWVPGWKSRGQPPSPWVALAPRSRCPIRSPAGPKPHIYAPLARSHSEAEGPLGRFFDRVRVENRFPAAFLPHFHVIAGGRSFLGCDWHPLCLRGGIMAENLQVPGERVASRIASFEGVFPWFVSRCLIG